MPTYEPKASGTYPMPRPRKPGVKKCDPARYVELCTTAQFFHRFCTKRGISERYLAEEMGLDPKLVHELFTAEDPIHMHHLRRFPRRLRAELMVEFLSLPDVDPDLSFDDVDPLLDRLAAHG